MEVIEFMKSHGSITTIQAFQLGITRLASRIHELRKDGFKIVGTPVKGKNRHGKNIQFFRYSLVDAA